MRKRATGSQSAQNKTFLSNDGLIYNCYIGDQNASTVKSVSQELSKIVSDLRGAHKRVLIFADISRLGKAPLSARVKGVELMKSLDFDKVAIFGPANLEEKLVKIIILASGRGFQVRYFTDEVEAKNWLKLQTR